MLYLHYLSVDRGSRTLTPVRAPAPQAGVATITPYPHILLGCLKGVEPSQTRATILYSTIKLQTPVGGERVELTLFTLRDRIYSPALHHHRSCPPNLCKPPRTRTLTNNFGDCCATITLEACGPTETRTQSPLLKRQLL